MRRAAKVDANHGDVVRALRHIGALVIDLSANGKVYDLLVGYRGKWSIMEVKNPNGRNKMTPSQIDLQMQCQVRGLPAYVVESPEEALGTINGR